MRMLECDNIYKVSGIKTIHGKHCHSFCYMTWRVHPVQDSLIFGLCYLDPEAQGEGPESPSLSEFSTSTGSTPSPVKI